MSYIAKFYQLGVNKAGSYLKTVGEVKGGNQQGRYDMQRRERRRASPLCLCEISVSSSVNGLEIDG